MTTLTTSVTAGEYTTQAEFVRSVILEREPTAPVQPGAPLDALVIQNQAYLAQLHSDRLSEVSAASSLQAIVEGLAVVSDADVDKKVGDYFITRTPAVRASGLVRIVTSNNSPLIVQVGFRVSFSTLTYSTTVLQRIYASTTPGVVESATDRILTLRPDGQYEATITVQADQDGLASRLAAGTSLVINTPSTGMVGSSVATDFSGGTSAETNQDLVNRALAGVTAKTLGGGLEHVTALVTSLFPGTLVAALGIGDVLFTRDQGNLLGISTGGKMDLYVKPSSAVQYKTLAITGTVTDAANRGVSTTISRTVAAGIYRVLFIRPSAVVGSGGNGPTSVVVAPEITTGWNPTLLDSRDTSFSARQVLTVVWTDSLGTGTFTNGQLRTYNVDVAYSPQVQQIDDAMVAPAVRPGALDVLVKAGVPCIVAVNVTVFTPASFAKPAAGLLQSAITNKINSLGFGSDVLTSYSLHTAIAAVAPNSDVTALTMSGLVYAPDGTDVSLAAGSTLTVPVSVGAKYGPDNVYFSSIISSVSVLLT